MVERTAADAPRALVLEAGVVDLIVVAVELDRPRIHEAPRVVVEGEAAHVQRPQIEARRSFDDPFRHHAARPAAGGDAVEEARGDIGVVQLRRLSHDEIGIGGIGDRPVDELAHADLLKDRRAPCRQHRELLETVEIARQQLAGEILGDAGLAEGPGVRLIAADGDPAHLGLVVDQQVRIAQGRHVLRHVRDRIGHQILMLQRQRGHAHAGHPADLSAPHAGPIDQDLAGDIALVGAHPPGAAALDFDAGNPAASGVDRQACLDDDLPVRPVAQLWPEDSSARRLGSAAQQLL